jgi:hypothetical protein
MKSPFPQTDRYLYPCSNSTAEGVVFPEIPRGLLSWHEEHLPLCGAPVSDSGGLPGP